MSENPSLDFRQSECAGSRWRRSNHGEFNNPYGGTPWIKFDWEDRIVLGNGQTIGTPAPSTLRYFDNPDTELELLNPQTGEQIGKTITHGFVYMVLFSLARDTALLQEAEDRRAAEAEASFGQEEDPDPHP